MCGQGYCWTSLVYDSRRLDKIGGGCFRQHNENELEFKLLLFRALVSVLFGGVGRRLFERSRRLPPKK
ncbi:hypothetical protein BDZ94DRAFT_1273204 [Collybia nuda]|uniref:Uncharacterized protein n=1 Tax=Collybia nuda TaxID=64659 RepID=A0A9P5XXJ1_9AGAR|nr:hypothetical protein BDZ94DRAFT_1273204 [Collybia nuda]